MANGETEMKDELLGVRVKIDGREVVFSPEDVTLISALPNDCDHFWRNRTHRVCIECGLHAFPEPTGRQR